MINLKIANKNYEIKYGYESTLKADIITKIINTSQSKSIDSMLLLTSALLLAGLQKNHKDEFGYNYDTGEGKEEQMEKIYEMLEQYCDEDEKHNLMELNDKLQGELLSNRFLSKTLDEMNKRVQKAIEEQEKAQNQNN